MPQIEIKDLADKPLTEKIESFLLDGSSLITDLHLLMTLANRENCRSYLEIGTWRGESAYNVAKILDECVTVNLSAQEMKEMGWNPKYAEQHGILSGKNPGIQHLEANTKEFDFSSLQKKYDLIFIDGDHSYEMVLNDTRKVFTDLVHENSVVVWHDYAYNPQKVRYEVFKAILDGVGKQNLSFLYHPKNTICAVFYKGDIPSSVFDEMEMPTKIFEISVEEKSF
ncbi:class I SAM-dependent methyltransferase [Chryseobacterium sp.]|uniref:class I SAM-dependent methyltransferase n=1 Tax=Chryseobacterium sp. TaxID=1871047 RepID=UPI0016231E84|nr:class I SAM-dependent methyltransferase [Chryseobacterium sp.]